MGKLKKILKKVGKAALLGSVGYAAMKGLGGKKTDSGLSKGKKFLASGAAGGASLAKQDRMAKAVKAMTSNDAYSDDTKPSNLGTMRSTPKKRNMYSPGDGLDSYMAKGGRAGYKHGGKAVRGVSKILLKGKR
jgi:hypothetical protein